MKGSLAELRSHFRANPLSWLVALLLLMLVGLVSFFIYHMDVAMRRTMLHHDQAQHLQLRTLLLEQQIPQGVSDLRLLADRFDSGDTREIARQFRFICDNQSHYARLGVFNPASGETLEQPCRGAGESGSALFPLAEVDDGPHGLRLHLVSPAEPRLETLEVQVFWPRVGRAGEVEVIWGLSFSLKALSAEAGIDHHGQEQVLLVDSRASWLRAAPIIGDDPVDAGLWPRMQGSGVAETGSGLFFFRPVVLRDPMDFSPLGQWKMIAFTPASRLAENHARFGLHMVYLAAVFVLLLLALYFYSRGVIGAQVRMVTNLKRKQAFLDSLLDSSSDAMVTLDLDGRILASNARAETLFGFRASELQGRSVEDLLPSDYQTRDQDYEKVYGQLLSREREYERRELVGVRVDGEDFPVEVTYCRLKMQVESRLLLIIREITERKVAERELDNLRMQYFQQEKMAQVGLLVAGILHEVGNPLAAIRGLLGEVLEDDRARPVPQLDGAARSSLELVLEQTDRIRTISHEISGFASPHQHERGPLSLNAILEGTARLLSYDKRWRDIELVLDLDPQLPAMEGVTDQLTQVFMNLLVNASDAFPEPRSGPARVEIATRHLAEGVILVSVIDNGQGIDKKTMVHIFDAFYTTKPRGKGTGLGLSICEKLIEEHRGTIEIESRPGAGTRVRIFFEYEPMTFS